MVRQLPQHIASQNTLNMIDVQISVESLLDRQGIARDPNLQFRIKIEVSGGLNAEMSNVLVK
jgi:hypothetical protein